MNISSRFAVAIHILTILEMNKAGVSTSDYIAESVNTNPDRGQLVRKAALIDMLWPEFDMDKAYPQLYTAIYHIRKTLEPYNSRFQITNTREGYVLNMEDVELDTLEEALDFANEIGYPLIVRLASRMRWPMHESWLNLPRKQQSERIAVMPIME